MTDRITANLPSRDFDETEAFYKGLGFERLYRGEGWMILGLDGMELDFFPHPEINPDESWFSASMRLKSIDAAYEKWRALSVFETGSNRPRLDPIVQMEGAPRMFFIHDPSGSLWRVMESGE